MTPETFGTTRDETSKPREIGRRQFLATATTGLTLGFFLPTFTRFGTAAAATET